MWNKVRLPGSCLTRQGVILLYVISFGVLSLVLPVAAGFIAPKVMLTSDYVAGSYPAGRLILENRAKEIYVTNAQMPLIESAFNKYVHELLPDLPNKQIALFMYPPLTAVVFAAFAWLSPASSLVAWQIVSIGAFFLAVLCISVAVKQNYRENFWYSLLYMPVFYTLLIGQCGIVLGLLPLAAGFLLLTRQYPFLAGMVWSIVLLKPQFLPIVLLFMGALVLNRKYRCLAGFLAAVAMQGIITGVVFGPELLWQWLNSLKVSDNFFCDPRHTYRFHLMTCLPAAILHLFPLNWRDIVKIPTYLAAMVLGLHALWISTKLLKHSEQNYSLTLCAIFIVGIAILPLVEPHFFLYDFSVFAFFAILLNNSLWNPLQTHSLKILNCFYLLAVDIYYFLSWTAAREKLQPMILMMVMSFLYYRLIIMVQKMAIAKNTNG